MAGSWLLSGGGGWLAAVQNPSPRAILRLVQHAVHGLAAGLFWTNPLAGGPPGAARALVAGAVAGLGRGLPVGALGQSFAWAYFLRWPAAGLPGGAPAVHCACLLGAGLGLGLLLGPQWREVWTALPAAARAWARRTPAPAGRPADGAPGPDVLLLAALPAFALRWLLRHLTVQLEAAATVGVCLLVSAQVLRRIDRSLPAAAGTTAPSPRTALFSGLACGLAALPGVSGLAALLAVALHGGTRPVAAGRFALMTAALVAAALGLSAVPGARGAGAVAALAAFLGAGAGAYGGGWLLLRWLDRAGQGFMPRLAAYCEAVGGLLLLFGVFAV